jgi:glucokinase
MVATAGLTQQEPTGSEEYMSGLIADIGGTNVRFALVDEDSKVAAVHRVQVAD